MRGYFLYFQGAERPVAGGVSFVGRALECALHIEDSQVAPRHAKLRLHSDELVIEDLGTVAGTRVNGVAISAPRTLRHGDTVEIAGRRFIVRLTESGVARPIEPVVQRPSVSAAARGLESTIQLVEALLPNEAVGATHSTIVAIRRAVDGVLAVAPTRVPPLEANELARLRSIVVALDRAVADGSLQEWRQQVELSLRELESNAALHR